jgi:predicted  nucleic acid-binding Zn-ribbon protein
METIEEHRGVAAAAKKELEAAKVSMAEAMAVLDVSLKNWNAEVEKISAERKAARKAVDPDVVHKYERIRKSGIRRQESPCVVPVRDGACECCHMNVTAQARVNASKGAVVTCENCGALLYSED